MTKSIFPDTAPSIIRSMTRVAITVAMRPWRKASTRPKSRPPRTMMLPSMHMVMVPTLM